MSFNNVLNTAGPAGIILFEFLECAPQLPSVSQAMKAACEKATTTRLRRTIELRDKQFAGITRREAERICNGRPLETVLAELMEGLGRTPDAFHPRTLIREMYTAYTQQNPEARDEAFAQRLLVCLPNLTADNAGYEYGRAFLAQERLAKRAREVLPELQGQLQPQQLRTFLYALQMDQDRLNLTEAHKLQLDAEAQKPDCFSRRIFVEREEIGLCAERLEADELRGLWQGNLRWHLPQGPAARAPLQSETWVTLDS